MPAAAQPLLSCFLLVEEMVGTGPRAIFLSRRVRVDVGIGVVMCGSFDSFFVPPDLMVASPLLVLAHATHRQRKLGDLYCLFVICLLSEWREPSQCRPSAHTSGPTFLSPALVWSIFAHLFALASYSSVLYFERMWRSRAIVIHSSPLISLIFHHL